MLKRIKQAVSDVWNAGSQSNPPPAPPPIKPFITLPSLPDNTSLHGCTEYPYPDGLDNVIHGLPPQYLVHHGSGFGQSVPCEWDGPAVICVYGAPIDSAIITLQIFDGARYLDVHEFRKHGLLVGNLHCRSISASLYTPSGRAPNICITVSHPRSVFALHSRTAEV